MDIHGDCCRTARDCNQGKDVVTRGAECCLDLLLKLLAGHVADPTFLSVQNTRFCESITASESIHSINGQEILRM
jgi:hypothetical protein